MLYFLTQELHTILPQKLHSVILYPFLQSLICATIRKKSYLCTALQKETLSKL